MKLLTEQIKEDNGKYYHYKKYDDGSISSEEITLEIYLRFYEMFGGRGHYDY